MKIVDSYTDGSATSKFISWAFIIVDDNKEIYHNSGVSGGEITKIWSVGGEITAVIESIKYCKLNNYKVNIRTDFKNLILWTQDLFSNKRAWKRNNKFTQEYRRFIEENRVYINSFIKEMGHSDSYFNNSVHSLSLETLRKTYINREPSIYEKSKKIKRNFEKVKELMDIVREFIDGVDLVSQKSIEIDNLSDFVNESGNILIPITKRAEDSLKLMNL